MLKSEMELPVLLSCALSSIFKLNKLTNRAAEILKEVKPFVEEGVGSHIIIKGLKAARDLVSLLLESSDIADRIGSTEDQRDRRHDRQD
jgi:hypothetical protein